MYKCVKCSRMVSKQGNMCRSCSAKNRGISEATRIKMIEGSNKYRKANVSCWLGRKHSEESRNKMKISQKNVNRVISEEQKKAIKEGCRRRWSIKGEREKQSIRSRGKNNYFYKNGKTKCSTCGIELTNYDIKFCRKCWALSIRGSNHHRWRGGTSFIPYPKEWQSSLKKKIRARDNYVCQVCGKTASDQGMELSIHHIDYSKDNLSHDNLISLCHSCHGKTQGKRQKWIKFFKNMMRFIESEAA